MGRFMHHLIVTHELTNIGGDRAQLRQDRTAAKAAMGKAPDRTQARPIELPISKAHSVAARMWRCSLVDFGNALSWQPQTKPGLLSPYDGALKAFSENDDQSGYLEDQRIDTPGTAGRGEADRFLAFSKIRLEVGAATCGRCVTHKTCRRTASVFATSVCSREWPPTGNLRGDPQRRELAPISVGDEQ